MRRTLRAIPTLLRVGLAEAVAYRAEMLVWLLSTTMPLVMLALMSAVAREAPVGRFGQADFAAYYLAALVVRLNTGAWVIWEVNFEIRQGTLAFRLLRPIHPLVSYACANVGAMPLRIVASLPIVAVAIATLGPGRFTHDPLLLALFPLTVVGAWLITFLAMAVIGALAFAIDSSSSVFELWLGLYGVFSGYLIPLELFPRWLELTAKALPFRFMLSFPVELVIGMTRGRRRSASSPCSGRTWRCSRSRRGSPGAPGSAGSPRSEGRVRRYLTLLGIQVRASLAVAMQYRVDFLVQGGLALFWTSWSLVPILVVYGQRASIAGWSFEEALVVIGWFTVMKGVLEGAVNPSLAAVVEHIRKGTLDFVLLKPADAQFLVSTAKFAPWRSLDVVGGDRHLRRRVPPDGPLAVARRGARRARPPARLRDAHPLLALDPGRVRGVLRREGGQPLVPVCSRSSTPRAGRPTCSAAPCASCSRSWSRSRS